MQHVLRDSSGVNCVHSDGWDTENDITTWPISAYSKLWCVPVQLLCVAVGTVCLSLQSYVPAQFCNCSNVCSSSARLVECSLEEVHAAIRGLNISVHSYALVASWPILWSYLISSFTEIFFAIFLLRSWYYAFLCLIGQSISIQYVVVKGCYAFTITTNLPESDGWGWLLFLNGKLATDRLSELFIPALRVCTFTESNIRTRPIDVYSASWSGDQFPV